MMSLEVSSGLGYTTVQQVMTIFGEDLFISGIGERSESAPYIWPDGPCRVMIYPFEDPNRVHFLVTLHEDDNVSRLHFNELVELLSNVRKEKIR